MTKKINRRDFIKTSTVIGLGALAGCSLRNRFDLLIKNGLVIEIPVSWKPQRFEKILSLGIKIATIIERLNYLERKK